MKLDLTDEFGYIASGSGYGNSGLAGPGMQVLLPSRSFRILVVDDCLDTTESLRILLEVRGHQVDTACDGPTGLEVALRFHPEVVLLDIGLPRVDGYQVARRLRQVPGMEDILLIAMTGF